MNRPVIGLVGVGPWGKNILRDLNNLGAVVHAAARHAPSIARAVAEGAASIVSQPEDLPAECQGFVVANRTVEHLGAIERLLIRGRPIFVEKPLTVDVEGAHRLPPSAQQLVFVMHKWRYHPGVLALAEIAAREEFGPVQGLRTFRLSGPVPHVDVNAVWILLPHDLSIALEILGEIPVPVSSMRDPLTGRGHGLIARLSARNNTVGIVSEVSSGHAGRLRRIVLSCRDAICELQDDQYDVIRIQDRASSEAAPIERRIGREMPLEEELRAFLSFLAGGPPPKTSFKEELRLLEVIETLQSYS